MTSPATPKPAPSDDLLAFAITETFGPRCQTTDADCYTCQAWAQYDRALATIPAAEPVAVVRQLEWEEGAYVSTDDDNGALEGVPHKLRAWRAGPYTIIRQKSERGLYLLRGKSDGAGFVSHSFDEVKAVAQADYEQRIRSALVAPQPARETDAARDVLAERRRQIEAEGWTPEHDDEHTHEEMALAAACYACPATTRNVPFLQGDSVLDRLWPWDRAWWKPALGKGGRRRSLIKAGALILAEIERLDRAALRARCQP